MPATILDVPGVGFQYLVLNNKVIIN